MTAMNDTLNQKLAASFARFDTDGDGCLQQGDFQAQAQRTLQALGEAPDSPQGRALFQAFNSLWTNIDTGGNRRVSQEEYNALMNNPVSQKEIVQAIIHVTQSIVSIADRDGDGKISRVEFQRLSRSEDPQEAVNAFVALDADGDGYLTSQEIVQATEVYFSGTDEATPGNGIFLF